jgi:ferredoxin
MTTGRWLLDVDMIACDGRGVCAELLPERIQLDDWGYPVVDSAPIDPDLLAHARRAVAACPVLALRLSRLAPPHVREQPQRRAVLRDRSR